MSGSRPGARPAVEEGCYRTSVMAFFIAMMGVSLQMFEFWYTGIALVIIALWLVYNNEWATEKSLYYKPSLRSKDWNPATINEYNKLVEKIDRVSDFNRTILGKLAKFCSDNSNISLSSPTLAKDIIRFVQMILIVVATVAAALVGVFLFMGFAFTMLEIVGFNGSDRRVAFLVLGGNTLIFALAFGFFFLPKIWTPHLVSFKLPHFDKLMQEFPAAGMGDWTTEFQLELSKADDGKMPTDIKMVIKPPDAPPEFYGVQAQISINMGGPYVYFVIVTKEDLKIRMPRDAGINDILEPSSSDGVNILVIRNYTTKNAGFITKARDVRRLLQLTKQSALATTSQF